MIPTFGYSIKSKLALNIAMKINDFISLDRNYGIAEECFIPKGKTISKREVKQIIPKLKTENVTGGAVWYESIALNTERLLFEFLHEAYENGAVLANYTKAENYIVIDNKISSVKVLDEITKEEFNINAKVVVNSVGPWLNDILTGTKDLNFLQSPLTKAVNIIVKKKLFKNYAVGLESVKEFKDSAAIVKKGKRLFFFVPLGEYTMIGTTYKIFNEIPDKCTIEKEDVLEIITEVNSAYDGLNLSYDDVTQTHIGTQATSNIEFKNEFDVQPETHSLVFDHAKKGNYKNLISVKSVKYTTAPSIAKQIIDILKSKNISLDLSHKGDNLKLSNYNKSKEQFYNTNSTYSSTFLSRIWNTYGIRSCRVIKYIEQNNKSKELVFDREEVYLGELLYNHEYEMAIKPEDFVARRIGLNSFEKVPTDYLLRIDNILNAFFKKRP